MTIPVVETTNLEKTYMLGKVPVNARTRRFWRNFGKAYISSAMPRMITIPFEGVVVTTVLQIGDIHADEIAFLFNRTTTR